MQGDMNGQVGNIEAGNEVGRWSVEGVNENEQCLVDAYAK